MMQIFKYLDAEGFHKFLENWSIAFKHPHKFNDPFDCLPVFVPKGDEEVRSEAAAMIKDRFPNADKEFKNIEAEAFADTIKRRDRSNIGEVQEFLRHYRTVVSCFSRTDASLLLWSKYGDSHRGAVVDIDIGCNLLMGKVGLVSYSEKRPKIKLHETESFERLTTKSDHIFEKGLEWAYEQEARVVYDIQELKKLYCFEAELHAEMFLIPIKPSDVRSVTLGARYGGFGSSQKIAGRLRNNSETQHIVVKQAELHPTEYRIDCIEVS